MTPEGATGLGGVAHRPSRPSRLRKLAEKSPADEAQLARMVRELHEVEDDIAAKLTAADRVLSQLAARRTHEDGGYRSWTEFEERMLATSPVLRAMRETASAVPPTLGATPAATKRDTLDTRARQTKALTSMARALERLRGLEAELRQCASLAASKLGTIEGMRVYEECGYASFEEFLERALGPSPLLANAVALMANEPLSQKALPAAPPVEPPPPADSSDEPAFPPALFPEGPELSGAVLSSETAVMTAAQSDPSESKEASSSDRVDQPVSARRTRASIVVSVLLCCAAIIAGAAAGVGGGLATRPNASQAAGSPTSASSEKSGKSPSGPGQVPSDVKPSVPVVKGTAPAGPPVTH